VQIANPFSANRPESIGVSRDFREGGCLAPFHTAGREYNVHYKRTAIEQQDAARSLRYSVRAFVVKRS
jgi:hypothetical protein